MEKKVNCPMCGTEILCYPDYNRDTIFYDCSVCGRYELDAFSQSKLDQNKTPSYLLYNGFRRGPLEYRYHTVASKEFCDKYRTEFDEGNHIHGRPVHMDSEIIENWYPKSFSEKIDHILLFLNSRIKHMGQQISLSYCELLSAMFIDRKDYEKRPAYDVGSWRDRDADECEDELQYMLNYLTKYPYIEYVVGPSENEWVDIRLTPEGYARVDVLQKNTAYGHNVLVAMKFGEETKLLREAIRKGIKEAQYKPIFIDEVQHNDFITPELLKYIRDSKFVVVDLTHQNNGAYFEEGYAMGLGKPVIQLCQKDTKLHFDIAQKNTIMWDKEDDISVLLCNRIKATID